MARIAPDRSSLLDFLYLCNVPKTDYNFRVTDKMLGEEPRGTEQEIAAFVLGECR